MPSVQTLASVALVFVVTVIVGALGVKIVADVGTQINNTQAQTVVNTGISALQVLFQWLPLLALVIVAVIIIALLLRGFPFGGGE
jgi:flagellar biosynthesis protein FlhB